MDTVWIIDLVTAAATVIIMVLMTIWIAVITVNIVYKAKMENDKQKYLNDEFRRSKEKIEYSEALLSYIKTFAAQVITLKFKEFLDNHHLEKLTRETIKKEIVRLATLIHESINKNNIDFERSLYTEKFIYEYIIQVCITMTKKMLDDALIDIEE